MRLDKTTIARARRSRRALCAVRQRAARRQSVRMSALLADAETQVLAETVDRELTDMFTIQDEVTEESSAHCSESLVQPRLHCYGTVNGPAS